MPTTPTTKVTTNQATGHAATQTPVQTPGQAAPADPGTAGAAQLLTNANEALSTAIAQGLHFLNLAQKAIAPAPASNPAGTTQPLAPPPDAAGYLFDLARLHLETNRQLLDISYRFYDSLLSRNRGNKP